MFRRLRFLASLSLIAAAGLLSASVRSVAQEPSSTDYQFSFPDAIHHVMQVRVTFHSVPRRPFRVEMARSSPGRYAAFEFASNIFEETFTDGAGRVLAATRPDPRSWEVTSDDGTVHVTYKLFGDRVDGTFVAIDSTHAHINFPSTILWAKDLENSPIHLTFSVPKNSGWKIATQLYPTAQPDTFTAPDLQYLMDSPAELSAFTMRSFQVPALKPGGKTQTIRVVVHSRATDAEFNTYFDGVQKLVHEEQAIYGELPDYEPGYYTFLIDALPWDGGDGMEHRNSTVITGRELPSRLGTAAHEFFHNWNVERIRPEGLEPFNFRDVNMSGEMFIAEGFTQYYGELARLRTGLTPQTDLSAYAGGISRVLSTPGTRYRSAMDMSRMAPFVDGSGDDFPVYWTNTFVSYYTYGEVIALGLDLTLRARTNSRVSLDDFMRAMWLSYGKPGGPAPGLVGKPYTIEGVEKQLAGVSGDAAFAHDFVKRYMAGTDKLDYEPLLLRAGFALRRQSTPFLGLGIAPGPNGPQVAASTFIGSPTYNAGLDLDDDIVSVAGTAVKTQEELGKLIAAHKVGDKVDIIFRRRGGPENHATATLVQSPNFEIVPIESTADKLSAEQKQFREAWLASKVN